jgi:hypothetical protein
VTNKLNGDANPIYFSHALTIRMKQTDKVWSCPDELLMFFFKTDKLKNIAMAELMNGIGGLKKQIEISVIKTNVLNQLIDV